MSASAGVLEEMFGSGCRGLQHHLHSPSAEQKVAIEPNTNHALGNSTLAESIAWDVYLKSDLSRKQLHGGPNRRVPDDDILKTLRP